MILAEKTGEPTFFMTLNMTLKLVLDMSDGLDASV